MHNFLQMAFTRLGSGSKPVMGFDGLPMVKNVMDKSFGNSPVSISKVRSVTLSMGIARFGEKD